MHSAVRPKPVAAILDIVRVSFPLRKARSFTWPVAGLVSFQKNWKEPRCRSSSNCASVPWNGVPPELCEFFDPLLQLNREANGASERYAPHNRSHSLRFGSSIFTKGVPRYSTISNSAGSPRVESGLIQSWTWLGSTLRLF